MDAPTPGSSNAATAASGRTVGNRYTLGATVGSGGMGTVWRAYDELLHRDVAVKEVLLPPGLPAQERKVLCERTLREARAAAALNHPAVVRVYDVVQDGERPWIVMELLDARNISEVLRDDGPMSVRMVAEMGLAVLGALEAAHRIGVLHRDVKPGNVLIGKDGRTTLTDFGVARSANESPLTSTGLLLGSPQYIAPERARGQKFGPPSDLWSLGAALYTAVEGRPPFDRGDPLPTMTAVVCEPPDPMTFAGPLAPILDGLLEKDPAKRWDAARTRAALRTVLAGGSVDAAAAPTSPAVSARPASPARPTSHARPTVPARRAIANRIAGAVAQRSAARALEGTAAMEPPSLTGPQPAVGTTGSVATPSRADAPVQAGQSGLAAGAGAPAATTPTSPAGGRPTSPAVGPPTSPAGDPTSVGRPAPVASTRLMPGMPATDQPHGTPGQHGSGRLGATPRSGSDPRLAGPQPPPVPGMPRRAAYLQSPEAMRASAAGDTSGIPQSASDRRRRLMLFAAAAVAVVLIAGIGAYLIAQAAGDDRKNVWTSQSKSRTSGVSMVPYVDPNGFSVKVPARWTKKVQNATRVRFYDSSDEVFIQLYVLKVSGSDQQKVWAAGERYQKRTSRNYERVSFAPAKIGDWNAVDWEWTFVTKGGQKRHVLDRGVIIDGRSYQLYFSAPEEKYATGVRLLDEVSKSFQVGGS